MWTGFFVNEILITETTGLNLSGHGPSKTLHRGLEIGTKIQKLFSEFFQLIAVKMFELFEVVFGMFFFEQFRKFEDLVFGVPAFVILGFVQHKLGEQFADVGIFANFIEEVSHHFIIETTCIELNGEVDG